METEGTGGREGDVVRGGVLGRTEGTGYDPETPVDPSRDICPVDVFSLPFLSLTIFISNPGLFIL